MTVAFCTRLGIRKALANPAPILPLKRHYAFSALSRVSPAVVSGQFFSSRVCARRTIFSPSLSTASGSGSFTSWKAYILRATHRDYRPASFEERLRSSRGGGGGSGGPGFFNRIPSQVIFWSIIAANGVVFVGWQYAKAQFETGRNTGPMIWMLNNVTSSWNNINSGRIWTPLTSCFSHSDLAHIFVNGFSFFFMAPTVLSLLGNARFIGLYFGGGIISSAVSLAWSAKAGRDRPSQGASGAIYSIVSYFACNFPRASFLIFGIIPCPAWLCVTGFLAYDSWSMVNNPNSRTDSAGHVGGLLAGIAYAILRRGRL
ncbi:rhomboid-domain-containing protein [Punctularia strigosozonata HHB-11173 SS5]|uniref:rhomboid-domain-containing protein n=1 Tax=Punctularia strigosozonata (strain HHB-11173) TaxID=741275 RepID=UPI00044183F9|nr:rhomboid-domain-containing protein [Punctularia strigosozonata HHB-11173 SS5]EIN10674.1 rhomboid-domain-containing protein [Punctularia strigosozonata HHB-11173 SS5]